MGRNKIKIETIKNDRIRQVRTTIISKVTFYKRKKGLLKKAMELSMLCNVQVALCIVDKNEKVTIYSSAKNVANFVEKYMARPHEARELLTYDDVKYFI